MRKCMYFIDVENVGTQWVQEFTNHLSKASKYRVIAFFINNGPTLSMKELSLLPLKYIRFVECCPGKNALGFQLSSELGCQLAGNITRNTKDTYDYSYYIVSKDTGYDSVVNYWTKQGFKVERIDADGIRDTLNTDPFEDSELIKYIDEMLTEDFPIEDPSFAETNQKSSNTISLTSRLKQLSSPFNEDCSRPN